MRWTHLILFLLFLVGGMKANKITVGPSSNLFKVISAAKSGDRVFLKKGTYFIYGLEINKALTLEGDKDAVIDACSKGSGIVVTSDGVTILNLKIQNTGLSYLEDRGGIKIMTSKKCRIENCVVINCLFGIYLSRSEDCVVKNNRVVGTHLSESQTGNAIHLFTCKNISVENNKVSHHRDGIYLEFTGSSRMAGNISTENIRYGLHFMFSHSNEYCQKQFIKNEAGIAVMYANHIYMHENIFADNWNAIANGILLKEIRDSRIEKNTFEKNTVGIYAEGVLRTSIKNNNFIKNGWALKILGTCDQVIIDQNNFIANTFEVVTNSSASANVFSGNYWSNYTGYDLNKDGIGDVPHAPVKLFTYMIEEVPSSIVLMRSLFIDLLDLAEKMTPVITPVSLTDASPKMKQIVW